MIKKLHQIITDHRAMNLLRRDGGDIEIMAYTVGQECGFDCYAYGKDDFATAKDPAQAIIGAIKLAGEIDELESRQQDEATNAY